MTRRPLHLIRYAVTAVALSLALVAEAQAMPIFTFSFTSEPREVEGDSVDGGELVEGQIFGLANDGEEIPAGSIVLTASPFNFDSDLITLPPDPDARLNRFNVSEGSITSVDLVAFGTAPDSGERLRFDFTFGELISSSQIILEIPGSGPRYARNLTDEGPDDAFSLVSGNEVPSPAPLALMGVGILALVVRRGVGR